MPNNAEVFTQLMHWIVQNLFTLEVEEWSVISWAIWNTRNRFIFYESQQLSEQIRESRLMLLHDFHRAKLFAMEL
jgi:hypothetical protein